MNNIPKDIGVLLSIDYRPQNRFVIVKYLPEYYENGIYRHNEWTSYYDIGKQFEDGVLTPDEYYVVETRFVNCIKELANAAGCMYVCIGYMENWGPVLEERINGAARIIQEGTRVLVKNLDNLLKKCLREEVWIVFINRDKGFMIDFGYDYYLHIRCNLEPSVVSNIVTKNHLYFDPRLCQR